MTTLLLILVIAALSFFRAAGRAPKRVRQHGYILTTYGKRKEYRACAAKYR